MAAPFPASGLVSLSTLCWAKKQTAETQRRGQREQVSRVSSHDRCAPISGQLPVSTSPGATE
jgi:hypothetical protein